MINYEQLTPHKYDEYCNKIALMNVTVYEDLYYFLDKEIPYACAADCILSPKDKYYNEYFPAYKKAAIAIYNEWDHRVISHGITKEDLKVLDMIGDKINYAKDSVELTWTGMQLHKVVSPYIKNGKFTPPDLVA